MLPGEAEAGYGFLTNGQSVACRLCQSIDIEIMQTAHSQDLSARLAGAWKLSCIGQLESARIEAEEVRHEAIACGEIRALALANEYLGWFCVLLSRLEDGLQYAQFGAALWSELGDVAHEAITRATLAWLMSEVGDEDAITEAQRAAALADQSGDYAARGFASNALCVVLWMLQQHDLAERAGAQAVEDARLSGDVITTGRWLSNAALPAISMGDAAAARQDDAAAAAYRQRAINLTTDAAETCLHGGDTWGAFIAFSNLAELQIAVGALPAAEEALTQAQALSEMTTLGNQHLVIALMTGLLLAAQGHREAAVLSLLEARGLASESGTLCLSVQIAKQLADTFAACSRFKEAFHAHQRYFELYVRRSTERSQVRARTLSRQRELDALHQHAAYFERLAGEDPLTGLRNRRGLDAQLESLQDARSSYGIAIIDVDHFKAINDTYSHIIGDEVLRSIGAILRPAVEDNASVGRFGGEEFLVILVDTSGYDGLIQCERLRTSISNFNWGMLDSRLSVTISIGLSIGHPGTDPMVTLSQADRNLYFAKENGRNCLVSDAGIFKDVVLASRAEFAGADENASLLQ